MSLNVNLIKVIIFALTLQFLLMQPSDAKPLGNIINDLFYDSSPNLEVPTDFINNELQQGKWSKPEVGYGFQFTNHPQDPDRFLRRETLNLTVAIPINVIENLPASVGPSLKAEFIRPFQKVSVPNVIKDFVTTAKPYGPKRVPHNHKNALSLKPEDYYSFTANLGLSITPNTFMATGMQFVGAGVYLKYVVSGDFKVEVYRLSGSKVKVIASSLRSKSIGFGAKVKFAPDLDIFGISVADKLVSKTLSADLIDWNIAEKNKGNMFSVSYIYDLETEAGKEAYDSLMDPREWKKPTFNINKISGKMSPDKRSFWLADLSESRGYAEDNIEGVVHVDHSELEFEKISKGIRLDILLADKTSRRHFMEIDYSYQPEAGGDVEHYRIANMEIDKDYQFLFNVSEAKLRREATAIFDLNSDQEISGFRELHFFYRREDKKMKQGIFQNEAYAVIGQMRKMLSPSIMGNELNNLNEMLKPAYENSKGSFVQMEMTFSPESLAVMNQLTISDISNVIDSFMETAIPLVTSKKKSERFTFGKLELFPTIDNAKNHGGVDMIFSDKKMNQIKQRLFMAFQDPKSSGQNEKQWEAFKELRESIIFRDFGSAFLVRLLTFGASKYGKNPLSNYLYFRARVKAEGQNEKLIHIGHYVRPDATLALLAKKDRVMNRSYNPDHFKEDASQ